MTVESTATTEAPAAAAPPAAPAAAPPAPAPAAKQTEAQILAAFDEEFDKGLAPKEDEPGEDAPEAEAKQEAQGEKSDEEEPVEAQDGEWEEGVVPPKPEDALPNKERAALKAIKDPVLRREFARAHYLVKAYEKSGMRLGAVHRYIAAAPTPEILEERITRAEQLDAFVDEFSSGDKTASARVAEVLRQTSPEGFSSLVDLITDNLHVVLPTSKMRIVGDKFFRAAISNMREKAEDSGDLVLADVADGVESFLGLTPQKKGQKGSLGRDKTPEDPEIARKLQAAEEVLRRDKEREQESGRQRYTAFNGVVVQDAVRESADFAKEWIEENCGAYDRNVKKELFDRLHQTVRGHIEGNAVVAKTLQRLMDEGVGDETHRARCADYLAKTIKSVFVTVAPSVLTDIQRLAGPSMKRREERAARARTTRDIGGSGAPAVSSEKRLSGKGKHAEDVLKEFDAADF